MSRRNVRIYLILILIATFRNQILEQTWIKETKERSSFSQILPQLEKLRGRPELQAIDPLARVCFIIFNLITAAF